MVQTDAIWASSSRRAPVHEQHKRPYGSQRGRPTNSGQSETVFEYSSPPSFTYTSGTSRMQHDLLGLRPEDVAAAYPIHSVPARHTTGPNKHAGCIDSPHLLAGPSPSTRPNLKLAPMERYMAEDGTHQATVYGRLSGVTPTTKVQRGSPPAIPR
jgi:hypothetical protein